MELRCFSAEVLHVGSREVFATHVTASLDLDCLETGPELPADSMFPATYLYQSF